MEYEGSIGLVSRKMIFFTADFHIFMAQKHDLSKKKFSVCRAVVRKFVSRLQPHPQKLESLNFGSRRFLGQLDAHHTQNFDKLFFSGSCHTSFRFSTHFACTQDIACKHTICCMQKT
jgi:hypothetical protein